MKCAGYVVYIGKVEVRRGFWLGDNDGKRQLGRRRPRWEDSIKMGLQKVKCGVIDWIVLA
jgi:hypothetical protein